MPIDAPEPKVRRPNNGVYVHWQSSKKFAVTEPVISMSRMQWLGMLRVHCSSASAYFGLAVLPPKVSLLSPTFSLRAQDNIGSNMSIAFRLAFNSISSIAHRRREVYRLVQSWPYFIFERLVVEA